MFLEVMLEFAIQLFTELKKNLLKERFPQGGGGQGMPLRKEYSSVFRFNLSENINIDPRGMWYL